MLSSGCNYLCTVLLLWDLVLPLPSPCPFLLWRHHPVAGFENPIWPCLCSLVALFCCYILHSFDHCSSSWSRLIWTSVWIRLFFLCKWIGCYIYSVGLHCNSSSSLKGLITFIPLQMKSLMVKQSVCDITTTKNLLQTTNTDFPPSDIIARVIEEHNIYCNCFYHAAPQLSNKNNVVLRPEVLFPLTEDSNFKHTFKNIYMHLIII